MALSKSKRREVKLRRRKAAIIASRNVHDGVNNLPINKPTFDIKVLKKVVFGEKDTHYVQEAKAWKQTKTKQIPKLRRQYKKWQWVSTFTKEKGWTTEYKLVQYKSEYFHQDSKPLTKEAYMEKLVEHKLKKWDKKNPKPQQDLFEKVEEWEQSRFIATERIRDFVVSVYDKLHLIGRFKTSNGEYKEEEVAVIKDIDGEGHNVNNLSKDSKLLKKAQQITNTIHAKRGDLVSTNLKDHKQKKGRIILPTDLMMMRKAA